LFAIFFLRKFFFDTQTISKKKERNAWFLVSHGIKKDLGFRGEKHQVEGGY